jgi:hypothetical protein
MLVDMSGNLVVLLCEWNLMLRECNTFFLEGEIRQLNTRRCGGELEYKDMGKNALEYIFQAYQLLHSLISRNTEN